MDLIAPMKENLSTYANNGGYGDGELKWQVGETQRTQTGMIVVDKRGFCTVCSTKKTRLCFSKKQWKATGRVPAEGKCKECVQRGIDKLYEQIGYNPATRICSTCDQAKERSSYSKKEWKKQTAKSTCNNCKCKHAEQVAKKAERKWCGLCLREKTKTAFSKRNWRNGATRRCKECTKACIDCMAGSCIKDRGPDSFLHSEDISAKRKMSREFQVDADGTANVKKPRLGDSEVDESKKKMQALSINSTYVQHVKNEVHIKHESSLAVVKHDTNIQKVKVEDESIECEC